MYVSRTVYEIVNLAVLVDELVDGVGQGRELPVEQILESNVSAADVEVDVGVEDAQLLGSGGSNGDNGGRTHTCHSFKGCLFITFYRVQESYHICQRLCRIIELIFVPILNIFWVAAGSLVKTGSSSKPTYYTKVRGSKSLSHSLCTL